MNIKKIIFHTILSIGLAGIFFLPDFIFKLFHQEYFIWNIKVYKEFVAFFIFNFIILSIANFKIKYFVYALFMLFSFSELLHYSFFHSLIMPYEIPMLFSQSGEMLDTLEGVWSYMMLPIILFIIMLILLYIILKKSNHIVLKGKYIPIILTLLILSLGSVVASKRESPYVFLPKVESSSIKNMYNVLSWSIAKELPKMLGEHKEITHFKSYMVNDTSIKKRPHTIIVVMGESLGAKYMSLYGFKKETTPKLDKIKNELLYTWGYSAGVNTDVSVPTFFMLKREPKNNMIFLKGKTNLFALAKQAGYTTHYITTQKLTVLGGFLGNNVDNILSKKDFNSKNGTFDEVLVDYLRQVDFSKKNFIVLHQRNSHSPYVKQTPKEFYKFKFIGKKYKEYMQNSYFNSLLYTDTLYTEIIKIAKEQSSSAIVFFTSDHSEMLGNRDENGRFGHSYLGFSDAKVPMIIYLNKRALDLNLSLNLKDVISHYQFGKLIAKSLGKRIINPNEDGEYFINGVDISGSQGYLKYKKLGVL